MADRRGVLFLVVGASGVGKDSLIDGARRRLAGDAGFDFPERFVTRSPDAGGEIHRAVTASAFDRLDAEDAFMLRWRAHGHRYGIPKTTVQALAAGRSVVVNVSRQVIDEARQRWPPVRVLLITAPRDIVAARLAARGREAADEIARRLDRIKAYDVRGDDVREVTNVGRLDRAVDDFVMLLVSERRNAITQPGTETDPSA